MNKYEVLLDILRDKILFLLERYKHNSNIVFLAKNLFFLANTISKSI